VVVALFVGSPVQVQGLLSEANLVSETRCFRAAQRQLLDAKARHGGRSMLRWIGDLVSSLYLRGHRQGLPLLSHEQENPLGAPGFKET